MDLLENYYGKQTFLLYSLFAKVPSTKSWPRMIFLIFSIAALIGIIAVQLIKLVEEQFERGTVIALLPTTVTAIGTLIYLLHVVYATEEEYNTLLSIMVSDLTEERTRTEETIKRKFARSAGLFINANTIIYAITICAVSLSGFVPYFLDFLIPRNESRKGRLFVDAVTFIDQDRYFYLLHIIESNVFFMIGILIGVTENMSVIFGQHACGMMAIHGYRLENLTRIENHEADYRNLVNRRLTNRIKEHQNILQLVLAFGTLIAAFYDVPLTIVLIGTFSTLTVSLVQVTDPELVDTNIVLFTVVQISQLFILSIMGQIAIDASERVAFYAYDANWYNCSPDVRKFLQLIILRASKPCTVVAANMYTLSVESFISVMQTITSFYMVLRQTQ